jgi:hypothetical protein
LHVESFYLKEIVSRENPNSLNCILFFPDTLQVFLKKTSPERLCSNDDEGIPDNHAHFLPDIVSQHHTEYGSDSRIRYPVPILSAL